MSRWKREYGDTRNKARIKRRLTSIAEISLVCMVCGSYDNLQLDHHVPRTPEQKYERIPQRNNRAVLCISCNAAKGDMYPTEFVHYLKRLGAHEAVARYIAHLSHRHKD